MKMLRTTLTRTVFPALVLTLLLTACGFHRQGTAPMPAVLKVTYIDTQDEHSEFQRGLRTALKTVGTQLVDDKEKASATLVISKDETGRNVLSVSARNTPREYEIYYTVTYSVVADGKELLQAQTSSLTRDYSFDEQTMLAKEHEEEILRQAMARDLVSIVMRRLSSL